MSIKRPAGGWLTERLHLRSDYLLAGKYRIVMPLGSGWEGEVYLIREIATGVERTAKIFYPQRNKRDRSLKFYARKLHTLRHCPIVIQYHTREVLDYQGIPISFLVSEYVEGEMLSQFVSRQPGKRLTPFQAIHLLHSLANGINCIHQLGEYHGDLHTDNVIVQRYGLGFELKLLDMFQWGDSKRTNIQLDVVRMIQIFHEVLGGNKHYPKMPDEVKEICCGLKRSLIAKKFRTAGKLKQHLENLSWE